MYKKSPTHIYTVEKSKLYNTYITSIYHIYICYIYINTYIKTKLYASKCTHICVNAYKKTGRICSKLILVVKEACSMKYYVSFKKNKVNIHILT